MRVVLSLLFGLAVGVTATLWATETTAPVPVMCPIKISGQQGLWLV